VTVPTGVNEKPKLDTLSGKYIYRSDIPSKTLENGETVPSIRDKKRLLTNTVPPDLIRSSRRKDLTGRKVGVIRRGVEPEGVNYVIWKSSQTMRDMLSRGRLLAGTVKSTEKCEKLEGGAVLRKPKLMSVAQGKQQEGSRVSVSNVSKRTSSPRTPIGRDGTTKVLKLSKISTLTKLWEQRGRNGFEEVLNGATKISTPTFSKQQKPVSSKSSRHVCDKPIRKQQLAQIFESAKIRK
jgi:hypothetical protein